MSNEISNWLEFGSFVPQKIVIFQPLPEWDRKIKYQAIL